MHAERGDHTAGRDAVDRVHTACYQPLCVAPALPHSG